MDCIIPDDDSVCLLSQFIEEMNLTDLYSTYTRIGVNMDGMKEVRDRSCISIC